MHLTKPLLVLADLASVMGCTKQSAQPAALSASTLSTHKAIATTRQVMLGITTPASDIIFQVGAAAPKDAAEWEKVQASAAVLAESGNMLMVAPRAVDQEDWTRFCESLIQAATAAAQTAQEQNVEKVLETGNQVYEVCDGCHKKYLPARAGESGAGPAN